MATAAGFVLVLAIFYTVSTDWTESYKVQKSVERRRREDDGNSDWTYEDQDSWPDMYEDCGGKKQSPIFYSRDDSKWIYLDDLQYSDNYAEERSDSTISNNGKWIMIELPEDSEDIPYVEKGDLPERFYFDKVLFHFGSDNEEGAEHTWDRIFPERRTLKSAFEVQIFHMNEGKDKYFVLHSVFTVGEGYYNINKGLQPIVDLLPEVTYAGDNTKFEKFNLSMLIVDGINTLSTKFYYRYEGSLTFPPCTENVIWNLFRIDEMFIDPMLLDEFRKVKRTPKDSEDAQPMADNYRKMQDANERLIIDRNPNDPNGK